MGALGVGNKRAVITGAGSGIGAAREVLWLAELQRAGIQKLFVRNLDQGQEVAFLPANDTSSTL